MNDRPMVFIQGCFHEAQAPTQPTGEFWYPDQKRFAAILESVFEKYEPKLVAEEAHPDFQTSAARLAKTRGIPYMNVDIPPSAQKLIRVRPRDGRDPTTGAP